MVCTADELSQSRIWCTHIKNLGKYIKVDIYGGCGMKCLEYDRITKQKDDCKKIIAKEYLFYLAFENSICKDYITEKFFIILRYNIIPVVMGVLIEK